jgi:hypothetical protein
MATLAEWYHKGEMTPQRLEAAFVDFVRVQAQRFGARVAYCDSAEPTLIEGLRAACMRERLPIEIRKAKKSAVQERIRFLCRLMAGGRYQLSRACPHTKEALQTAVWDARRHGEDVRLDDGSTNIDSLDALEYSYEPYMREMMAVEMRG